MSTTASPDSPDLAALRKKGGAEIPETQLPPQKQNSPKVHYGLCGALTFIGLVALVLGLMGAFMDLPFVKEVYPWAILMSIFFIAPGATGLYRGPGAPATHVIPRPKNRKPIDYAAGAGGAAGPAPTN